MNRLCEKLLLFGEYSLDIIKCESSSSLPPSPLYNGSHDDILSNWNDLEKIPTQKVTHDSTVLCAHTQAHVHTGVNVCH